MLTLARSKNYSDVDVLFSYAALLRLHKVAVFKHSNCHNFHIPLQTELMQRERKLQRRGESKSVLAGFS